MTQTESAKISTRSQYCLIVEAKPGNYFLLTLWSSGTHTRLRLGPLQLSQAWKPKGPRQDESCLPACLLACQPANPIKIGMCAQEGDKEAFVSTGFRLVLH